MPADARRFLADLEKHSVAVADTNVLIYHLEGLEPYVDLTRAFLRLLASRSLRLILSPITIAEVLAGPYRKDDRAGVEVAESFIEGLPNTEIGEVNLEVADRAAWLRTRGFRMPDALVMATAVVHSADVVITNDPGFRTKIRNLPPVMLLDEYTTGG